MPLDSALSAARVRAKTQVASSKNPPPDQYIRYTGHLKTGDFRKGVMLRRGGGLLAMWRVEGLSPELYSAREYQDKRDALNGRYKGLHGGRRLIAIHEVKTFVDRDERPAAGECRTEFAREVDERYANGLHGLEDERPRARLYREGGRLMRVDLYVSAYLRPAPAPNSKFGTRRLRDWKRRWAEWRERKTAKQRVRFERFREMETLAGQLEANLAEYRPRRLGVRENPDTGVLYSEMYEALHHILYNEKAPIGLVRGKASRAIYTRRIIAPADTVHICRAGTDRFGRLFTNRHYSVTARPEMHNELRRATYAYTMTNVFGFWEMRDGHDRMTLRRNQFLVAGDPAVGQEKKLLRAADRLQDKDFAVGGHHFSFACYADDAGGETPEDTNRLLNINAVADRAWNHLQDAGLHPFAEDLTLEAAVYAQLPDNEDLQPCPGVANTLNLAAWAPLYRHAEGMAQGPWGPAILTLLTRAWTAFNLHLQAPKAIDTEGDLGNTLVIGPAGSGKTVLLAMLIIMAEKFGADVVVDDKDRGLEILVRFLRGVYLRFRSGHPTGANPLKGCGPDDVEFLHRWYLGLRSYSRQEAASEDQERRLRLGLNEMLSMPPAWRSNRELRAYLGDEGAWLDLWIHEGERKGAYGWAFDGPDDRIMAERHPLTCRDMTELLDHQTVCDPMVAYLAHADRKRLDGKRKLLRIMDETWKGLSRASFGAQIKDLLKTIRKLQGAVVLATQDVTDILESPIASAIMHESPTRIWMADPRASESTHFAAGLTEPMWRAIKTSNVVDHAFLVEQQVDSVVCRMPLPPDLLAVMSGTATRVRLMDALMAGHGEDIDAWGPHYRRLWHTAKTETA